MKKKFCSIFFALVLVFSFSLVTAVPVAAQELGEVWVDDDWVGLSTGDPAGEHTFGTDAFATITEGITAVDEGGTVHVAAGTYEESLEINKCLTLVSTEGPENTKIDVPSGTGIEIKASGVTVEGFKVSGDGLHYGIIVRKGVGVEVLNNVVTGTTKHGAIELYGNLVAVTVSGNTIDSCAYGIVVDLLGQFSISGCTIADNTITGSTGGGWGAIPFTGEISDITISGNEISDNEGMSGILFGEGIYKDIVVENNTVSSNLNGVQIKSTADFTNLAINHNNIENNTEYGVYNEAASSFDATNNWWGATNGPSGEGTGGGDAVSANVLFTPWLESPYEESGGAVSMTAASEEAEIGISVSPTFIDFQTITSGEKVAGDALTVKNTGNVRITIDADITADTVFGVRDGSDLFFYTAALRLGEQPSNIAEAPTSFGSWTLIRLGGALGDNPMWANESRSLTTGLECPPVIEAGIEYTGTVVFWAEQPE